MTDRKRSYSKRDLRAIDAVALGLIGAGLFLGLRTWFGEQYAGNPAATYLASGAMVLCGTALAFAVRRQQRDQDHPDLGDAGRGEPPAAKP